MPTKYWKVDASAGAGHPFIQEAGRMLKDGKTVAFPTETVYGLGADARSTSAVNHIFSAKGRPSDNPLIVHIAGTDQLGELVDDPGETALRLIEHFWPGPLTLVLPAKAGAVSPRVTAGLSTVAVRMPAHPVAQAIIAAAGCPVAAPSANRSGRPSPTLAAHVLDDLDGRIDGIVDGGPAGVGVESTVVEVAGSRAHILRPGGVTLAELRQVVSDVTVDETLLYAAADDSRIAAPRSPGMKYQHYAPQGAMTVVAGHSARRVIDWIQARLDEAKGRGEKTGVLTYEEHAHSYRADLVVPCGSVSDPASTARKLYGALRAFDHANITFIMAESCSEEGIGAAVMNRLLKAAGNRIVRI